MSSTTGREKASRMGADVGKFEVRELKNVKEVLVSGLVVCFCFCFFL